MAFDIEDLRDGHVVAEVFEIVEGPDDFFVGGDFDDLGVGFLGVAVADDGVAVGEALAAAGVAELAVDVAVVAAPDDVALGVELDGLVPVGEVDE